MLLAKKDKYFLQKTNFKNSPFFLSLTWRTWGSRVAQVCVWCLRVWRYWILPGTSVDLSAPHPHRPPTESFRSSLAEEHRSGLALVTKRKKRTVVKLKWSWIGSVHFYAPTSLRILSLGALASQSPLLDELCNNS